MNGAAAKRGTHGLRKRCPVCKHLRKFCAPGHRIDPREWQKVGDRWVCVRCVFAAKPIDPATAKLYKAKL